MDAKQIYKRLGISAVVGMSVVVVVGFLARMNTEHFEKRLVTHTLEHLQAIARTESQHIERRLIDTHDELRVLAENPKVKEVIINGWTDKDGPAVDSYRPEKLVYEHLMNDVSSLYRLDNKGIVQTRFPWKKGKAGDDYSLKPGVKMVLKDHRPYVSEVFKSHSGIYCISVCYPVFDQKQFIGILRAVINLDVIHACLKDSDIGPNGYAWMIDDNGTVISHPETRYVGKNMITVMKEKVPSCDWSELQDITNRMAKGEKGTGFYCSISPWDRKLKDTNKLTAFVPVRIKDQLWSLGVVLDYDEISAPVKVHSRNVTIGAALLILTLFGAGGWFYKIQKEKAKLIIEAESADKLRSMNQQLTDEITERKKAEEEIKQAKECYDRLTDNANEAIFRVKATGGHVIYLNRAAERIFGYSQQEWKSDPSLGFKIIHPDFAEKQKQIIKDLNAKKEPIRDVVLGWIAKDGHEVYMEYTIIPVFDKDGQVAYFESIGRDITERKQAEEQIKLSLEEKELLLREVHHRTKNNFQVISSMLYLQSEYFDDKKVFDVLEKSQNRIKSMAAVHEQLYRSENLTNIDFDEYARTLLVSLYHSCGISESSISFQININRISLGIDQAIPCGLIINELFSNSLEHAFPQLNKAGNPDAQICIDMHKNDGHGFTLVVSDNGIGFTGDIDSMKGRSLGLFLVKNLIEQLEGTVELDTEKGAKFTIKFPSNTK